MKILGKDLVNRKEIKILGTYSIHNECLMQSNTASGISLFLKGKEITITLDCFSYRSENDLTPYALIKNHDYKNKDIRYLKRGENKVTFKLPYEFNTYDLIKLDEAEDDTIYIKEVLIDGELKERDKRKEALVIGDSTTAAYGNLGDITEERTTMNSDGSQGYTYMALSDLGYDIHMLTASGFGVYASHWTDPNIKPIVDAFNKLSIMNLDIPFDYSIYNPEVIVLSLGTNDLSYIADSKDEVMKKERTENFIQKYYEFILYLNKTYKDSKIVMCYGCCKEEAIFDSINKVYEKVSKETENIHILRLYGDGLGSANHPSLNNHYEMKESLKEKLIEILK